MWSFTLHPPPAHSTERTHLLSICRKLKTSQVGHIMHPMFWLIVFSFCMMWAGSLTHVLELLGNCCCSAVGLLSYPSWVSGRLCSELTKSFSTLCCSMKLAGGFSAQRWHSFIPVFSCSPICLTCSCWQPKQFKPWTTLSCPTFGRRYSP